MKKVSFLFALGFFALYIVKYWIKIAIIKTTIPTGYQIASLKIKAKTISSTPASYPFFIYIEIGKKKTKTPPVGTNGTVLPGGK